MEFRDFCLIFVHRRNLFAGVLFVCIAVALFVFRFQPPRFETSLTLNVSRSGTRETTEYAYDQFYRLQADERFADTVVRWLSTKSLRADIRERAGVHADVVDSIRAKRLSSQMIAVTYVASDPESFGTMRQAVPDALNLETTRLNEYSKDEDWFIIIADTPVVSDARITLRFLISLGTALGVFVGFWAVLADWYVRGTLPKRTGVE